MIDLSHTFEMKGLVMLEMTGLRSLRNLSVGAQHNI